MRLAALPMYDLPELAAQTDAFWRGIASRLRAAGVEDVPDRLQRRGDPCELWRSPQLLFAQTCGFPLMHDFAGKLTLVATPCYSARGCEGSTYRSFIVVRANDPRRSVAEFRGAIAAINSEDSHSGFNILRWRIAREKKPPFFTRLERTGSHVSSLAAVQSGRADLAAIDCVTFALLERHRPSAVAGVRILEETPAAPALPFVTAASATANELRLLRQGLADAVADPALSDVCSALLLKGVEEIPLARYEVIRNFARVGAVPLTSALNPA
jgi:ABC-type phosphate/phosphonate transport system substrate-binding protein